MREVGEYEAVKVYRGGGRYINISRMTLILSLSVIDSDMYKGLDFQLKEIQTWTK